MANPLLVLGVILYRVKDAIKKRVFAILVLFDNNSLLQKITMYNGIFKESVQMVIQVHV